MLGKNPKPLLSLTDLAADLAANRVEPDARGCWKGREEFAAGFRAEEGISVPLPTGSTAGTAPHLEKARALSAGILETAAVGV